MERRDDIIRRVAEENKHLFKLPMWDYKFSNPEEALEYFSFEHGISYKDLTGRVTARLISDKRKDAMRFVYCTCGDFSVLHIARLFDRDHTTVLYALGVSLIAKRPARKKPLIRKPRGVTVSVALGSATGLDRSSLENPEVRELYQHQQL